MKGRAEFIGRIENLRQRRRPAATETGVLKQYAQLVAVGAAVRRHSVSLR